MESYVNEKPYDQIPLIIFFGGVTGDCDDKTKKAECIYDFDTTEAFLEKIQLNDIARVSLNSLIEKDRQYYWKTLHIHTGAGEKEHYAYFRQKERNSDTFDENPADKVYDDWKAFRQEKYTTFKDLFEAIRHPQELPEGKTQKDLRKEWRDLRAFIQEGIYFPELDMDCNYKGADNGYTDEQKEDARVKQRAHDVEKDRVKQRMFDISHYFMLYDTDHMKKQVSNWVKNYNTKQWRTDKWV